MTIRFLILHKLNVDIIRVRRVCGSHFPVKLLHKLGSLNIMLSFHPARSLRIFFSILTWPKFSLTSHIMLSELKRQDLAPATVIDVGANVGQFAVASAKTFPYSKIYSFEPNPASANRLKQNVKRLGNIEVYELALGEDVGEVDFHVNAHSHSSSILSLASAHLEAFPEACESTVIAVKVSTLDTEFKDRKLQHPVLLKLDVQGYELPALRGGKELLKRVDYVLLEASFRPMYQDEPLFMDIVKEMHELGFEFLRPAGFLRSPSTGEYLQMDALFQRRVA